MRKNKAWIWIGMVIAGMLLAQGAFAAETEIVWYVCCNQQGKQAFFEELAKDYSALNPRVEIKKVYPSGNYTNTISTQLAAGTGPDIMWMGQSVFTLTDFAYPMNDIIKKDTHLSQIPPNFNYLSTFDGKILGLVYGANSGAMFYNKDMFQTAGLAYPTANWTFDDLTRAGRTLTKDTNGDGKPDQFGMGRMLYGENWWWPYTWGGDFFTPDGKHSRIANPVSIEAMQWYVDNKLNRWGTYPTAESGGTIFNGKVAIDNIQAFQLPDMKNTANFDWDVQLMPQFISGGKAYRNTYVSLELYVVNKYSKNLNETLEFARWLLSPETLRRYGQAGFVVPAHREIAAQFFKLPPPPANILAFVQGMEYGKLFHYNHPLGNQMASWLTKQTPWQAMWRGEIPASVALPEVEKGFNLLLDEYNASLKK